MGRTKGHGIATVIAIAAIGIGCDDTGETDGPAGAATATSSGATSGVTSGGGGAGGQGGQGGQGGAGGAGVTTGSGGSGGGSACFAAAEYAALFTLLDPALCVVAIYDADLLLDFSVAPSWGRHGGPLTVHPAAAAGSLDLVRWSPPAGVSGAMTSTSITAPTMIPAGAFPGAQALDLPFFDWTAVSYTDMSQAGELILLEGAAVAKRYAVNGIFATAGVAAMGGQGRLLYSGFSVVGDAAPGASGLYAADSCGAVGQDPRLLPGADPSCGAPLLVDAWGDFSGPVATDSAGNAFAILTAFGSDQEARGFAAPAIARGAPATTGDTLFSLPGFGAGLAAIAPAGAEPGLLAFQPSDPDTFAALDVIAQRYTVAGSAVAPSGATGTLLELATPGTGLTLMNDDEDRIWVGVPTGSTSKLVVIARAP